MGAVVTLQDAEQYCDAVAVPVTVLRPSVSALHPDPGNFATMTSAGRYVTRTASSVTLWDPRGSPVHTFGRAGEGPGEFVSKGALSIFVGVSDTLYVLDGGYRWSVFEPQTFEFVRTFRHPAPNLVHRAIHVTAAGILYTADLGGQASSAPFHIVDLEGDLVRSFGPTTPESPSLSEQRYQHSAYDGTEGFWVVPRTGAPTGLSLEYWTLEGERMLTLKRDVPWLPPNGYPVPDDPAEIALPEYEFLHIDSAGLIWVGLIVRDARWRPGMRSENYEFIANAWDIRVEVIDPRSGTVVASFVYDGPSEEIPPMARWLNNSNRSYRPVADDMQLVSLEFFDIRLTAK